MFIKDIFPIPIGNEYLNDISDERLLEIKNFCSEQNFHQFTPPISENQFILDDPFLKDLKEKILKFTKNYLEKKLKKYDKIEIASSWAVKMVNNGFAIEHSHSNSLFSGVFYLDEGSPIYFTDPNQNKWWIKGNDPLDDNNPYGWDRVNLKPSPKLAVIFPSWLFHGVKETPDNSNIRMSIAFNIIPRGLQGTQGAYINL